MKIIKKEVKKYKAHNMCECGGEFEASTLDMIKEMFIDDKKGCLHICNKCGKEEYFYHIYPTEIEEEVEV